MLRGSKFKNMDISWTSFVSFFLELKANKHKGGRSVACP